ncbi:uncharacterized protein LOC124442830 [Xenia sp. Carnegie-2017]|uniref:uncharacterized protein LOC124442830 n=1 Tax=Xenia sp. Carnegie-2017 TaxID=2897299 RepID=UPI001F04C636|nr:uncharacterized protein LOC124442830 [Xenia sp. Carnegie-2017]
MTVWAKIVPFPWQDNRLVPGVSDPEMLEFNMSCIEEVVMPGVVSRNLTVDIAQVQRKEKNRLEHNDLTMLLGSLVYLASNSVRKLKQC